MAGPVKHRDLRTCLEQKLDCDVTEGGKHTSLYLRHEGLVIAATAMPRSRRDIGVELFGRIAKQLNVRIATLRGAVECSVQRPAFIDESLRGSS